MNQNLRARPFDTTRAESVRHSGSGMFRTAEAKEKRAPEYNLEQETDPILTQPDKRAAF